MNDTELLADMDKRLALIEADQSRLNSTRKWVYTTAFAVFIQMLAGAVGYGKLIQKVEGINLGEFESHVNTLLAVAGQHGEEFVHMRDEVKMIRGEIKVLRSDMRTSTTDRFYKSDGLRHENRMSGQDKRMDMLEGRIVRMENILLTIKNEEK